jgi:hypothetical protein
MLWIAARWIVASMKDIVSRWDITARKFICDAVRRGRFAIKICRPVSATHFRPGPGPAFRLASALNPGPKVGFRQLAHALLSLPIRDASYHGHRGREIVLQHLVGIDAILVLARHERPLDLIVILPRADLHHVAHA